jgi:hypothetical protein
MPSFQRRTLLQMALGAPVAASFTAPAAAATWPSQQVRLVCPFAAGGPTDVAARIVAEGLTGLLPQRVLVENRTGPASLLAPKWSRRRRMTDTRCSTVQLRTQCYAPSSLI